MKDFVEKYLNYRLDGNFHCNDNNINNLLLEIGRLFNLSLQESFKILCEHTKFNFINKIEHGINFSDASLKYVKPIEDSINYLINIFSYQMIIVHYKDKINFYIDGREILEINHRLVILDNRIYEHMRDFFNLSFSGILNILKNIVYDEYGIGEKPLIARERSIDYEFIKILCERND